MRKRILISVRVDTRDFVELENLTSQVGLTRSAIIRKALKLGLRELQETKRKEDNPNGKRYICG